MTDSKSPGSNTAPAEPVPGPWRRYLRFSMRGMIVLVLVIGGSLGWIVRNAKTQRDAVAAIIKVRGQAFYEINPTDEVFAWKKLLAFRRLVGEYIGIDFVFHVMSVNIDVTPEKNDAARQQALARVGDLARLKTLNLCGLSVTDRHLGRVAGLRHLEVLMLQNTGISDAGLTHVRALTSLQEICITNAGIGDDGLNHLTGLTKLKYLTYIGTRLTDLGMKHLKHLGSLQTLHLDSVHLSDAGLKHLTGLSNLKTLSLRAAGVTDAGLVHLKSLNNLSSLDLLGTRVSDTGVKELKQFLPSLKVTRTRR